MLLNKKYLLLLIPILPLISAVTSKSFAEKTAARHVHLSNFTAQGTQHIIKIELRAPVSAKSEKDIIPVTALISMPFDYDDELEYRWLLTENVVLAHGAAFGKISQLKAQKKYALEIQVQGFSKIENRQIIIQVSGIKNGRKLKADAIISSKMEDTFENIVQNVEKMKMETHK